MRLRLLGLPLLSCVSVCVPLGCTEPDPTDDEVGDGDGDSDTTDGGTDTGSDQLVPARGNIQLTQVVVNQGVDVPIAADGVWVGPEGRNTYLVGDRDSLVRAYWTVPDGWVARDILATLEIEYPDGTRQTLNSTKTISENAYAGDLNRGFWWQLIGDQFDPGLKFQVKLWEVDDQHLDQPESTSVIAAPIEGLQLIGVQSEPVQLKIQMVPVKYDAGTCHTDLSTLSQEELDIFINNMHEQNPVQEVQFTFRPDATIEWNQQFNDLAELHQPLRDLRAIDNAPPNMYYYAIVDVCGGGIGDAAGVAPGTPPPTKDAADARVASGVYGSFVGSYAYQVFVHEIGHCQGRPHTECPGNAGMPPYDDEYTHENGVIGGWGFGIRFYELHHPTATYDYMSYCGPNFASDYTWSRTFNQARELTSWDFEDATPDPGPQGQLLFGLLMPNGAEQWSTATGGREPDYFSGEQTVAFDFGEGEELVPAAVEVLDGGSLLVVAPVPQPNAPILGLRRITSGGESLDIDLARLNSRESYTLRLNKKP
jgi:hypothetical protein